MSVRAYFIVLMAVTALNWGGWTMVLMMINPFTAGMTGFLLFYGSLFLALVGTFALMGFGVRVVTKPDEVVLRHVRTALRQAVLLSLLVVAVMILQSQRNLLWWNSLLLVLFLAIVEIGFISYRRLMKPQ